MNKILFIIPSCSNNGTNSSLSAIYNGLIGKYDISVLPIDMRGDGNYAFLNNIISSRLLYYYYGDFATFSNWSKICSFPIKVCKRILANRFLDAFVNRIAVRLLEITNTFDCVVAFQEGLPTKIAACFSSGTKIAWIHSDYSRAVDISINEFPLYQKYSKIVCVSKYTMRQFLDRYPLLRDKVIFIYNLFDAERVMTLSRSNKASSIMDSSYYNIVSIGRMDPVKRFSAIPKLANRLKSLGVNFRWYIIGGPHNDEYEEIYKNILLYNLENDVLMLGYTDNPYRIMSKADLYVSTSISEACPMVFLEAKVLGVPILSTDFGSAYEFVDDSNILPLDELPDRIVELSMRCLTSDIHMIDNSQFMEYNSAIMRQLLILFS